MDDSSRRGRRILILCIALMLLTSITVVAVYVHRLGTGKLPVQTVRVLLTAALGYWLYQGSHAAKWLTVALLTVAGVLGIAAGLETEGTDSILPFTLAATYLLIARTLIWSHSINWFLAGQRGELPLVVGGERVDLGGEEGE